jgi:hypothetical protein
MFNTTVKFVLLQDGVESCHTCTLQSDTIDEGLRNLEGFTRKLSLDPEHEDDSIQQVHYSVIRLKG